jgi:hypothetical protein
VRTSEQASAWMEIVDEREIRLNGYMTALCFQPMMQVIYHFFVSFFINFINEDEFELFF